MAHRLLSSALRISALALTLIVAACVNSRSDAITQLANRPDMRDDYAIFSIRCSKCHSLARPLNSGITDDRHWDQYVARMRRQPGSGINDADAAAILRFLHAYSATERQQKQEPALADNTIAHDGGTP